jgi:hypothetical protein
MSKSNKVIEASAIVLEELDSLRRQVKDMELQRANLLAEVSHGQNRIIALSEDKIVLLEETLRLKAILNEMAQVTLNGLDKLKSKRHDDVAGHPLAGYAAQYGSVEQEVDAIIARRDGHSNEVS